jgi:hypothetical protein
LFYSFFRFLNPDLNIRNGLQISNLIPCPKNGEYYTAPGNWGLKIINTWQCSIQIHGTSIFISLPIELGLTAGLCPTVTTIKGWQPVAEKWK